MGVETNERLRTAMAQVGVTIDDLADEAGVDPKSVQRWIGGRIPHRRNRWTTAKLLGTDPEWLWPETDGDNGKAHVAMVRSSRASRAAASPRLTCGST
jgi:lambda repressor-like predicted transcriptional regulator